MPTKGQGIVGSGPMDRPPGTVRSRVAGGVAKLRARRAAGRQSGTYDILHCLSYIFHPTPYIPFRCAGAARPAHVLHLTSHIHLTSYTAFQISHSTAMERV